MAARVEIVITAQDNASGPLRAAGDAVEGVGKKAQSAGGGIASFAGALGKVGLVAGGALIGGLTAVGAAGLGMNNTMEQVSAKLNAFTKDSAVTKDLLKQISDEASRTPFAFQEMANATANLMSSARAANVPVMDLVKQAEILAASNPAQGLEGAAIALKEAAGGDLTSIIERFDLPRQRLKELKEQGVPALEAVSIAMKEMGLDTDLVANMANTAQGRWSTFTDTLTNLAAQMTQPIFDAFSQGLAQTQTGLDAAAPALNAFAATVASAISAAIPAVMSFLASLTETGGFIQTTMPALQSIITSTLTIISAFWAAHGAQIVASAQAAWTIIQGVIQVVIGVIQGVLAIAAGAMTGDWTTAMAAIRSANDLIWNGIRTVIEGVLNAILAYFGTTVDQVVTTWTIGLNQLATSATTAVNNALTALRTAIAPAVDIGSAIIDGIVSGVTAAAQGLADAVAGAAADALQAAKDALGISSPSAVFRDQVGKQISAGMSEGVIAGGAGVASATTQVAQGAVRGAQSITVNQNINGGSMDADRLAGQTARMLGAQLAARG